MELWSLETKVSQLAMKAAGCLALKVKGGTAKGLRHGICELTSVEKLTTAIMPLPVGHGRLMLRIGEKKQYLPIAGYPSRLQLAYPSPPPHPLREGLKDSVIFNISTL